MGLVLDGAPIGVQAKEAPSLETLIEHAVDVGRQVIDAVREIGAVEDQAMSVERARDGLRLLGADRAARREPTVPVAQRFSPWQARIGCDVGHVPTLGRGSKTDT